MRLFVAVELSGAVRRAVAAEQERIGRLPALGDASLRWVRPEHMHLTLAFMGDADESHAGAIVEAMSQPIAMDPFGVSFGGLGVFPPRGAPRVLWLGLATGAEEVVQAQRIVAHRLGEARVALDPRPFHPHLTLARWRSSSAADARRVIAGDRGSTTPRTAVDAVTLYQSRLSPSGPAYTSLARAGFAGVSGHHLQ
jgi:2'-5' RNA ligase